ncbi:MAG: copper resistance CopC/CopD family protein [Solirubrobacterales bacterium]
MLEADSAPPRQLLGRRPRRLAPIVLAVITVLAISAPPAWGHAAFLESQPEAGSRLESGPGEIRLEFTEPLNRALTEATLLDASTGDEASARLVAGEEKELIIRPQGRLGRAPYEVEWQTVSTVDGHTLEGSFGFGVQTAPTETEQEVEQSPLARDGWLRIGARALLYASLFFFAGGVLNAALLTRRSKPAAWLVPDRVRPLLDREGRDPDATSARVWARTLEVGWLALAAAVAVALAEASDAGGGLSAQDLSDFLLSNGAGLARVGTVVAIAIAVLMARSMRVAASVAVTLAFLTIALSGHANSADPRSWAVVTDWIHLVAASIWIGGIAQIALAWIPAIRALDGESRLTVVESVLSRFGRVALPAFLVVAVTGLTNALIQLGHVSALWETPYGRVLSAKIVLVGLIALASYGHALRLRPRLLAANPHPPEQLERRHWRLVGVEPWLGLGAIVAVAALVAFPLPPSQLGEAGEAEAAATCDPCPQPRASGDELPVAEQAGSRVAAFWLRREGGQVTGRLRVLDSNERPVDAPVELDGAELESCGEGCWRFAVADPRTRLVAHIEDQGATRRVAVPSRWQTQATTRAKRLLSRAQRAMRALRTVRMEETLTSGIRGFSVDTSYRFEAPDRMAYRTSSGSRTVAIGKRGYSSSDGRPFRRRQFGADGFRLDTFFRWTAYGRSVRWLGANRRVARIALYDEATPLWYRLTIDRRTDRILRERMITGGHFMTRRYFGFDRPLVITRPR